MKRSPTLTLFSCIVSVVAACGGVAGCGGGGSGRADAGADAGDAAPAEDTRSGDAAPAADMRSPDAGDAAPGDLAPSLPAGFSLVKDVNVRLIGVGPQDFADVGDKALFVGQTEGLGSELYVTDGTAAGTGLLGDLYPGGESSSPGLEDGALLGGSFFFAAADALGRELWVTDGTAAGTSRLLDLRPGAMSSDPSSLRVLGGKLYFFARSADGMRRLWRSDGTAAGTAVVADVDGGELVVFGNRLAFAGRDAAAGREPWISDGTAAGTVRLLDAQPGTGGSNPRGLFANGATLYFWADDDTSGIEPWRSDGTSAGTARLKDIRPGVFGSTATPEAFAAVGTTVFFNADDGTSGAELWKSDGTTAGTVRVLDGVAGAGSLYPSYLTVVGGVLYFAGTSSPDVRSLWRSDGTADGTVPLGGGAQGPFVALGGVVLFLGGTAAQGPELWRSDGTAAGTGVVTDLIPGPIGSYPYSLHAHAGRLLYSCSDVRTDGALCASDGTAAGTRVVTELAAGRTGDSMDQAVSETPPKLVPLSGGALFFANDGVAGAEPYFTDGTEAGTRRLADVWPGPTDGVPTGMFAPPPVVTAGGRAFFYGADPTHGQELWTSDGTTGGTHLTRDVAAGPDSGVEADGFSLPLLPVGELVYFGAYDVTHGRELWRTDGTEAGTQLVVDLNPGPGDGIEIGTFAPRLAAFDGAVFLTGDDGTGMGTAIFRVAGAAATRVSPYRIEASELVPLGASLYFGNGAELWVTDGTLAGTTLVKNVGAATGAYLHALRPVGGLLAFAGNDGVSGDELWRSDGTAAGTYRVKDLHPTRDGISLGGYTYPLGVVFGGRLFFAGDDGATGEELWVSDLTEAGTRLLVDLSPGAESSNPRGFTVYRGRLYFSAHDGVHGFELHSTDGTAAGTVAAGDLNPGIGSGAAPLGVLGDALALVGNDGAHGSELWLYRAP